MSKRVTITVSDDQLRALKLIAEANDMPVATAAYWMLTEWIEMRALRDQIADRLSAIVLDAAASGRPH